MASLSILGLYYHDNTIFDNLLLPSEVDKDDLIGNLLAECAEFECLYADPDFMKAMIGIWSRKEYPIWNHLYETTQFEYNPIWNKDGTVTEKITDSKRTVGSQTGEGTSSGNASNEAERTEDLANSHYVSAFDEDTAQLANEDEGDNTINENSSQSSRASSRTSLDTDNLETLIHNYERVEKGNIGITTTQQMIREERDIALFNLMDHIINSFKQRFCLQVY